MLYGPGLHNFLKIIRRLVVIFVVLSVVGIMQIVPFLPFAGVHDENNFGLLTNLSFAAIGFPKAECSKAVIDWETNSTNFVF